MHPGELDDLDKGFQLAPPAFPAFLRDNAFLEEPKKREGKSRRNSI